MLKKIFSVLLSILLILGAFSNLPLVTSAASVSISGVQNDGHIGTIYYSIDDNAGLTLSGSGTLTKNNIPKRSVNDMPDAGFHSVYIEPNISEIGEGAFANLFCLDNIIIGDTVTRIGNSAFANSINLSWVSFGSGVKEIGDYAFSNCDKLNNIYLPERVEEISKTAFFECNDLTIHGKPGTYVETYANDNNIPFKAYVKGTTGDCTWTLDGTVLTISGDGSMEDNGPIEFPPQNKPFYGPWGDTVTDLVVSEGVTAITSCAFLNNKNLQSISLSSTVKTIDFSSFYGCSGLSSINVDPNNATFDSRNNCNAIISTKDNELVLGSKTTVLPNTVKRLGDVSFGGCTELETLMIPTGVSYIGYGAFLDCANLSSIVIPTSVREIGEIAFLNCTSLNNLSILEDETKIDKYAYGYCDNYNKWGYLNFDCYLMDNASICGTKNSKAKAYANDNSIPFYLIIGECPNCHITLTESNIIVDSAIPSTCNAYGLSEGWRCPDCDTVIKTQEKTDLKEHSPGSAVYENHIPSTCAVMGTVDAVVYCEVCGKELSRVSLAEPMLEHTIVTDLSVPATCTEDGLTEGTHCSVCGTVFKAQRVIPHTGHITVNDSGYPATCTEDGLTDGLHCSVCKIVLKEQEIIPKTGHKPIIDKAVEATCQHDGHTIGSYCENCGEVYVQSQVIPKLPHTSVVDPAVAADCTHTGLTEGSHCSVCNEIIVAQNVTIALGHSYEMVSNKPATYFHTGLTDGVKCSRCGDWLIEQEEIPKLIGEGVFCDVDGDGEITVVDATFISRKIADIEIPFTMIDAMADADEDGTVTIMDVSFIQRWLANMSSNENIGRRID